jgi:hypothetical protein
LPGINAGAELARDFALRVAGRFGEPGERGGRGGRDDVDLAMKILGLLHPAQSTATLARQLALCAGATGAR